MLFKKLKKKSVLQITAVIFAVIFAIVVAACPENESEGTKSAGQTQGGQTLEEQTSEEQTPDEEIIVESELNYLSGGNALSWGVSANANVLTLGMTPGDTTKELKINWYSSSGTSDKVAQVRFVRGTFTAGKELIEVDGTVATAGTSNIQHKATVTGLQPGASYQYAVSSDGTNWSEIYNFAVPAQTGTFKFAVVADPQLTTGNVDKDSRYPATSVTTAAGWKETMDIIVTKGVSFIASGGDQVDTSSNETQYTNLFAPDGIRSLPFAPVVGNHDTNVLFNYHYNLPNEQYPGTNTGQIGNYFYLYNNILFVVLNSASSPGSKNAASTYIEYYRNTIKAAKIAHPKYDWLIVQHHKSTASVADHCADTDIQYYVEAGFETLMSEEDVDFVLAGHDHVYARSYPLKGMDDGKVSLPDTTRGGHEISFSSGDTKNPIYLTFTTGSGLKYYAVSSDPYFKYNNSLYQKNNASYPYLGTDANGNATLFGSTSYMAGNLPVSNAAFVQPYIPSYTIVEVNGKTIKFSTYAIATKSGQDSGADLPYSFNKDEPYDWVQVTKTP
ncbi:purple acid phosphatase family protein [Treponema sp. R6D11]